MTADAVLTELARVAGSLASAVQPAGTERLLEALTETARRLFGAGACSLALLTDDESELVYTTAAGAGADDITGMRMPSGRGVAGWVVQSGQPVAVANLESDARFAQDVAQSTGYVPRSIVAAPVVSARGVLGVLSLLDRDADRPGANEDLALLQVFCDQAAIALETARALRDLGRVLLTAVAEAADSDVGLGVAAEQVLDRLPEEDEDLATLAALLAELGRQGAAERRLAVRLVREVSAYTGRRSSRPGA